MIPRAAEVSPAKARTRRTSAKASMRLFSISQFIETYFAEGSGPDPRTVRTWIEHAEVPGRIIGKLYFVDAAAFERAVSTGNDLADRILNGTTAHESP